MTKEALTLAHEELKHIKTWCLRSIGIGLVNENVLSKIEEALAHPEQRTWVGLTWNDVPNEWVGKVAFMEGAKWAETKLKEKNSA